MSILRESVNKLLIKIKKGDEKSKSVLFEKTYNHLRKFVYPSVRNKDDVEDVLVEAYLKVYQYIDSFNPQKDGYNWMCTIAKNVAYDWGKKFPQNISLEEWSESNQLIDLEEMIATKDEVKCWLQQYSDRDQTMMYLRFWDNKTIEEIALELNMGKSNVHKRISKILKDFSQKDKNEVEK